MLVYGNGWDEGTLVRGEINAVDGGRRGVEGLVALRLARAILKHALIL